MARTPVKPTPPPEFEDDPELIEATRKAVEQADSSRAVRHEEVIAWLRNSIKARKKLPPPWK